MKKDNLTGKFFFGFEYEYFSNSFNLIQISIHNCGVCWNIKLAFIGIAIRFGIMPPPN